MVTSSYSIFIWVLLRRIFCSCPSSSNKGLEYILSNSIMLEIGNFGFTFWMGVGDIGIFFILILYYRKVKGTIFRNR